MPSAHILTITLWVGYHLCLAGKANLLPLGASVLSPVKLDNSSCHTEWMQTWSDTMHMEHLVHCWHLAKLQSLHVLLLFPGHQPWTTHHQLPLISTLQQCYFGFSCYFGHHLTLWTWISNLWSSTPQVLELAPGIEISGLSVWFLALTFPGEEGIQQALPFKGHLRNPGTWGLKTTIMLCLLVPFSQVTLN